MGDALQVRRTSDWALQGGPCGVNAPNAEPVPPIWTAEQLLQAGPAPALQRVLATGPPAGCRPSASMPGPILEKQMGRLLAAGIAI